MNKVVIAIDSFKGCLTSEAYSNGETPEDPWEKSVQEVQLGSDFAFLKNAKEVKEISNENGKKTYEAIVDKEAIKSMASITGAIDDKAEFQDTKIKFIIDENNYLTRLTITISVMQESQPLMINMTINFNQFNRVGDIEIPDEIIETAVDAQA